MNGVSECGILGVGQSVPGTIPILFVYLVVCESSPERFANPPRQPTINKGGHHAQTPHHLHAFAVMRITATCSPS